MQNTPFGLLGQSISPSLTENIFVTDASVFSATLYECELWSFACISIENTRS